MKASIVCGSLLVAGLIGLPATPAIAQQRNSNTYTPKPNPLAPAQKTVHDAQADLNKVQATMVQIKSRLQRSMETKDDWKAAKAVRDQARAQYDAALRTLMDDLKKNPDYAAAIKQRNELQTQVDAANGDSKLTDEELQKLAADRSKVGITIANMEDVAKKNDPKLLEAKAKLDQADKDWMGLLAQVDEAVKQDPDYAKAEKDWEAASDRLKQARASLAQQAKAQRDAQLAADKARAQQNSSGGGGGGGYHR